MRVRRTIAVAAVIVSSVMLAASASAAPAGPAGAHRPIVISHLMSSCGHMDGL